MYHQKKSNNNKQVKKQHENKNLSKNAKKAAYAIKKNRTVQEKRAIGKSNMAKRPDIQNKRVTNKTATPYTAPLEQAAQGSLSSSTNHFSLSKEVVSSSIMPNLNVKADLASQALFGVGIGPVFFAVQRGWADKYPTYPFAAINFIGNILLCACLNTTPPVSELPYWLSIVYQALLPKIVTNGSAKVGYSWNTDADPNNFQISSLVPNGPSGLSYNLNFGVIQSTDPVNGSLFDGFGAYPIANADYVATDGAKAWSSLIQFLSNLYPGHRMHKLVSPTASNKFSNDASAFSISTSNPGGSFANTGAPGSRKSLEVPILTPMLAVFTPIVTSVSVTNRCPKHSILTGGGPVELGLLMFTLTDNTIRKTIQPKFKWIDFLRTADKIIRTAVAAVQMRVNDDAQRLVQLGEPTSINYEVTRMCPKMGIEDVLFCIRNEFMQALDGSQVFCQTLYPDVANTQGIVPFTATVGTCALGGINQMLLPILLAEEIKSYTARSVTVPNTDPGSKYPTEFDMYVGVLAKINGQTLDPSNYYVMTPPSGNSPGIQVSFFSQESASYKPKAPVINSPSAFKPAKLKADGVAISPVDGSGGSSFYAINTPDFLNPRIEEWNWFMTSMSAYIQQLVKIGKDGGCVTSLGMTDYITPTTIDQRKRARKNLRGPYNEGAVFTGYGSDLTVLSRSYRDVPIAAVEEGLPFSPPITLVNSGIQNEQIITNISSLQGEYHSEDKTVTQSTVLVSENTLASVNLSIMDRDAPQNATTKGLLDLSAEGGGGIFAEALGILGHVAGSLVDTFVA